MNTVPHQGLLLCQDLMFVSKVTNAAIGLGLRIEATGDIAEGLKRVAGGGYQCVIVDLSLQPLAISDLTSILLGDPPPPVIAFGAHVDTVRLEEARLAGCREVFPRSQFHAKLTEILRHYLGGKA
jgi:CheY-like chemotaxis protein